MPLPALITGAATLGAGLMGGGGGGQRWRREPEVRNWAREMARKYPQFQELALGPESMALASRMMGGELVPGVEKAYGAGAEREVGGLRSMLSEIGAGPASMGLARAGVMGRLGTDVAGARERAVTAGMGFAPQAFEMGLKPYEAAQRKWGDISNLFLQTPGAAYYAGNMPGSEPGAIFGGGGGAPATPAQTAMQNRMMEQQPGGASQYPLTPMQMAWQRMGGQRQPTHPASLPRKASTPRYGYMG